MPEWFRTEAKRIKSIHRIEVKLTAAEITKPQTKGNETVILTIQNSQIGSFKLERAPPLQAQPLVSLQSKRTKLSAHFRTFMVELNTSSL